MKPNYEFKRKIERMYIAIFLLFVITVTLLLFHVPLSTVFWISIPALTFILVYGFVLHYERLFLYDDFFVLRSILGVQIIYYEEIKRVRIYQTTKGNNNYKVKTLGIDCLNQDGKSLSVFHPSFLTYTKDKKAFFNSIQTVTPLFYIEKVFFEEHKLKQKNGLLFSLATATLIFSVSSLGIISTF